MSPDSTDTITYNYFTNHLQAAVSVKQESGSSWHHQFEYDAAQRFDSVASPAGTFDYHYSTGVGGGATTASRLIEMILYPGNAFVTNRFDGAGRLLWTKLYNSGSTCLNLHSYEYDDANRRTKQTRLDNSYVDYTYDDGSGNQ